MGYVKTTSGTVAIEEVEGEITLHGLFQDVKCDHYTDGYRIRCMEACGKLGRQAWGILHALHEIAKSMNFRLAEAAQAAIKKIDPGMPNLKGTTPVDSGRGHTPMVHSYTLMHVPRSPDKTFACHTSTGQIVYKKPEVKKVVLTDVTVDGGELHDGARVWGTCCFCEKTAILPKALLNYTDRIVGRKKNYCNFCLRNEFYKQKYGKNTLIMSFRGIIGYYYYCFHYVPRTTSMWLSDLQGYVDLHVKMGVQNPLFRYDHESFCWFVDFGKIGNRPKQMPLEYVLKTVINILASFNLYEYIKDCSPATFFQKYKDAIVDFHHHRRRPDGQKLLVPTLFGCGIPTETSSNKAIPVNLLKDFTPSKMVENFKTSNSKCRF